MNQGRADCFCASAPNLVFACSGAADVGALSDRAARALSKQGKAMMYCLAGVGGRVPPIMTTVESAASILAIDGCAQDCTKLTLNRAGFSETHHVRLTDLGFEKGQTSLVEEHIQRVVEAAQCLLSNSVPTTNQEAQK